jgi:hypothetical protein
VDQGYSSGAELVKQAHLGTQLMAPVGQDSSWQQREQMGYAVGDFPLAWPEQVATCPQGHQRVGWTQPQERRGHPTLVIRFATATCRYCPVREQCTRGQEGRTLTLTPPEVHTALPKTHLHHVASAAGLNLKRIVSHLHAQSLGQPSRPVRPQSPFARLQDQEAS